VTEVAREKGIEGPESGGGHDLEIFGRGNVGEAIEKTVMTEIEESECEEIDKEEKEIMETT
jgi:hypothetical protein